MTMTAIAPPIVPGNVITQEFRTPKTVQRGIVAGIVGNMLEWYDFALFGFFAPQIGAHFFPATNPTASLYNNRTQILAALEFACLDILGQAWGVPVCDILGGRLRDRVPFAAYCFFRYANPKTGEGEVRTIDQMIEHACALKRRHLLRSRSFAAADDRAGVAHAAARRRCLSGDECDDRLAHTHHGFRVGQWRPFGAGERDGRRRRQHLHGRRGRSGLDGRAGFLLSERRLRRSGRGRRLSDGMAPADSRFPSTSLRAGSRCARNDKVIAAE